MTSDTALVTISRAEYENLLQCRLKLASLLHAEPSPRRRQTSRIYRDAELAAFVDASLDERLTYDEIRNRCVKKFGSDRSPSTGAISRHSIQRR